MSARPRRHEPPRGVAGFALARDLPAPALVDRVLEECAADVNVGLTVPARLVVYVLRVMCLRPELGYQRLLHQVAAAVPEEWRIPNEPSFIRARRRLGGAVVERLFRELAGSLAEGREVGCWWRGRRVMAVDGSTLVSPRARKTKPCSRARWQRGTCAKGRPRARVVALIECGTRAFVDIALRSLRRQ